MKNIILIGMPASGKSTVGVLLAKALGMDFIDVDILIQGREGMLLQDILNQRGADAFLDAEERAVKSLSSDGSVISPGGSAVCREGAIEHLKGLGTVVYLRLSLNSLEARLSDITSRGIVMERGQTLADIYAVRAPLYEKYADIVVDTENLTLEQTVSAVMDSIK